MEWDPNQRDAWVSDAQRWICQINGVLQCKIDLDEDGEIGGVHVVAGMERDPRHIVRDVESLLKARLDMDVFYKKIGVVQVLDNSTPNTDTRKSETAEPRQSTPATAAASASVTTKTVPVSSSASRSKVTFHPPRTDADDTLDLPGADEAASQDGSYGSAVGDRPLGNASSDQSDLPDPIPAILVAEDMGSRVVCGGVGVMASDTTIRAEVHLRAGEVEARGLREGPNHANSDLSLVAQAAVAAVAELIADPVMLHLQEVRLQEVGGHTVVLTAIDLVEGRQSTTLFGTCNTNHNRQQAVVYSVLDAVNRRLSLHGLKTLEGQG